MIFLIEPNAQTRADLAEVLKPNTIHEYAELDQASERLAQPHDTPAVLVLGPGIKHDAALRFAEKQERHRSGLATLLVTQELDAKRLREALRSGVDDVLTSSATPEEWQEAVARALARVAEDIEDRGDHEKVTRGTVVSVFSTKGGSGKSLLATNLAVLIAERLQQRVCLVDLDLQSGDLAIMFQLMPALSIFDAAQGADRLDQEALEGYLTAHRSGVALLAAPMEPSLAEQVEPHAISVILGLLPSMFPVTIVDGPPLFTDQMLVALDVSDEIILVGSMDVPSIKNLKLAVNTINQLGHPRDHLRIVLNRADSKVGLRASEVEKSLGVEIDVQIPSSRDVPLSINQGTPLAISRPRSPVVQAIRELASTIGPAGDASTERHTRLRRR